MSFRNSARAGVFALAVLGSSLFVGATGPAAQASSCTESLGTTIQIKLSNGTLVALYYLGFNTCTGAVYSEVHFSTSITIMQNSNDYVEVVNGVGTTATNWTPPPVHTTSSTYWTSPMEPNTLNSSQTRLWYGMTEFDFSIGSTPHSCSAFTNTWNFSNGSVHSTGAFECDQS